MLLKTVLLCTLVAEATTLSMGALGARAPSAVRLPLVHRAVNMGLVRQVRVPLSTAAVRAKPRAQLTHTPSLGR